MTNYVWTINNYFDYPLIGIADICDEHYIFERIFDKIKDDWSYEYYLTPINDEDFLVVMQQWEEWLDWRMKFDKGSMTYDDWYCKEDRVDLEAIAKQSSQYHKLRKFGNFIGDCKKFYSQRDVWVEVEWRDIDN